MSSESAPIRSVKGANQGRRADRVAGLLAVWLALSVLVLGIGLIVGSRTESLAIVAASLPTGALSAFWIWVNRAELEISPEWIVIRSRWRRVVRARPRDLILPADSAIVSDRALVRVGGWSAGIWSVQRISALAEEAGVPLDIRRQQTPKAIRNRGLAMLAAIVPLSIAEIVWFRTMSISSSEIVTSVLLGLGSLAFLAMLWLRFRVERAVPGDPVEPIPRPI